MSRRPHRSLLIGPVVAIAAGLAVAACTSVATQSQEHNSTTGVSASVGDVKIANAEITLGLGGDGLLGVALFNDGHGGDALTGVTSPAATSFTLPAGATAYPGAYSGESGSGAASIVASGAPTTSATASATASTTPAAGTSAAASPASDTSHTGATSITLPAQTGVFLDAGVTQIGISGLSGSLRVGQSIPVTFTFEAAGSVTLVVPVTGAPSTGGSSPLPTQTEANVADGSPSTNPPIIVTETATPSSTPGAGETPGVSPLP